MSTKNLSQHKEKLSKLKDYLKELGSLTVAFSGGVDSTLLLAVANDMLGDKLIAVTISSPYIPNWEIELAKEFTSKNGIRHEFIVQDIPEVIKENPKERCYLCKSILFNEIISYSKEQGIPYVADGSNVDDLSDFRPGMKALKELNVKSPLLDVGFNKTEIRLLSKELQLPTWNRPAYACLLTRLPYDVTIKKEDLLKIEEAEVFLMGLGFQGCRVRTHDNLARIEINPVHYENFLKTDVRERISKKMKELGYEFVTLDLDGYRMGSFNDPQSNS